MDFWLLVHFSLPRKKKAHLFVFLLERSYYKPGWCHNSIDLPLPLLFFLFCDNLVSLIDQDQHLKLFVALIPWTTLMIYWHWQCIKGVCRLITHLACINPHPVLVFTWLKLASVVWYLGKIRWNLLRKLKWHCNQKIDFLNFDSQCIF